MIKSYFIDGKSISSNSQYRGTALRAISRFGESWLSYSTWSLMTLTQCRFNARSPSPALASIHSRLGNHLCIVLCYVPRDYNVPCTHDTLIQCRLNVAPPSPALANIHSTLGSASCGVLVNVVPW